MPLPCHLWNIPWSVADAHRSVQNILNPNRVQEYLKCFNDMAIMKGLNGLQSFKYSEINRPARRFFHI
uniref:Uncharacterized protein n=1 Tax=Vibrio sp. FF_304 TaxID=1652833 RepID=A0A0H3ZUH9_9VIBR|nr:hypothetical protein [Vibrio sp. FF_304]